MSDLSREAPAFGRVPVVGSRILPFDEGLAETQPIDIIDVNPFREENLT